MPGSDGSTPDLLREAAARLRADPQYGACFGPVDRGKHVLLVESLEERAAELEEPTRVDALRLLSISAVAEPPDPRCVFESTEVDLVAMAEATCRAKGGPHLPVFINAERVCYWCREPLE